jgi:very-short-patch-repair endonuclease
MDSHLAKLAATQAEVVAAWQLRRAGWSRTKISHHAARGAWRRIHPGVYVLTRGRPSQIQLWWAAALTTPTSFLSHGSAAACYGFHRFSKPFEVVTRPGSGGRRRHGALLVFRSKCLQGETARHMGIPMTTAERTLVDIAAGLDAKRIGRCFREAIRLKTTTAARVARCVARHGDAPAPLAAVARRYAKLPYRRTRSDAEARALELLADAGIPPPGVNVRIGGEEADLVWVERRLIVEIDGPQFHLFRDEDARKEAIWRDAGFTVRRVPSSVVYDDPESFVVFCAGP